MLITHINMTVIGYCLRLQYSVIFGSAFIVCLIVATMKLFSATNKNKTDSKKQYYFFHSSDFRMLNYK